MAGKASKKGGKTGGRGRWSKLLRRRWVQRTGVLVLVVLVGMPATFTLLYTVLPVPATPLMVARLFEGEGWSHDWVPREEISPSLGFAVIAAEDNLFCAHNGFDFESLQMAWREWQAGEGARGASTISMQTAKNLYLLPVRSLLRKGVEAYLTVYLEILLSKQRILEIYLNIAEWAPGVYGAEAAARHHFGKSAAQLTEREAALLAAVLPNPRRWSASQPTNYIAGRASTLQRRIHQLGPLLDCAR
ncbi:monofunctional biosynthetic peptidoglycan transglycosylase [Fodinicurvata halophila]|uniref:Biosynthetic peptidoglycan transglycosylase n=1 Tax=Fodinicurvata halophila TaxID=1419723 RepID=A0ABV8UQ30_9PROT